MPFAQRVYVASTKHLGAEAQHQTEVDSDGLMTAGSEITFGGLGMNTLCFFQ